MTRAERCDRCELEVLPGELTAVLPDQSKAWHEPIVCVKRQAERIKALEEENAALRADKERLVEVLGPFARFARAWDRRQPVGLARNDTDSVYTVDFSNEPQHIRLGDLRAARFAIDAARKGGA